MDTYKNKYFSILGDSISTLFGYIPIDFPCHYTYSNADISGIKECKDTWWGQVIGALEGKLLVNGSWSGSLVAKYPCCWIDSYGCSDERTGSLNKDKILPDVIMVYMGTNDAGWRIPLEGEAGDISCFRGAYSTMLKNLKKNYPEAEIWCLTLCQRLGNDGSYMKGYCDIISDCAKEYNCKLIDLYNQPNRYKTFDGLHPDADGMKTIAEAVLDNVYKFK